MAIPLEGNMFLGRKYDVATDSWVFSDGTGRITEMERAQSVPHGAEMAPLIDIWHLLARDEKTT
jgi:hypothetical protein